MKPRIQRMDGRWMCWTPSILCSRIVGWGRTPRAAWLDWHAVRTMGQAPQITTTWKDPGCWCEACDIAANGPFRSRMSLCPACGEKRCPRSKDHRENCGNPAQAQAGKEAQA